MPLMNFNGDSGADFSELSGMDYSNYGSSDAGGSEEFELNENPYARLAASSGGRQAFARNPTDFTLPGFSQPLSEYPMGVTNEDGRVISRYSIDDLYNQLLAGGAETGAGQFIGAGADILNSMQYRANPDYVGPSDNGEGNGQSTLVGTYDGDLRQALLDIYGPQGLTQVVSGSTRGPGGSYRLENYGSSQNLLGSYEGARRQQDGLKGIVRPVVTAGLGAMFAGAGAAMAGGAGTLGGSIAGGAAGGGVSGYVGSEGDWSAAGKGALLGALGGGLQQGASSVLDEWTTQAGNNPSAYRPGPLTQAQNTGLSRAIANTGMTAAQGGDYRQAALGGLLPMAGQMAQPYLNQGVSGLSSLFSGGDMPDDFFGGGDFSTDLNMRDWGRTGMPTAAEFNGDPALDMASWGRTGMPTDEDWYGSGGNGFNGVQNQPADQYSLGGMSVFGGGDGMQVGPGPTSMSGAPNNINPDDWSRKLREFIGGDAGRGAMRAFGILNPKYGQILGALMPQQPGGKMGGMEAGLGALATLYASNRANKNLKQQIGGLQGLFGPDSPYAQQMRQTLSRKDAAAGRRSQYGPREVELQARLAELNSRNAPQLAQLYNAQDQNRSRMLRDMLIYGQQSGLTRQIGDGLSSLFGG